MRSVARGLIECLNASVFLGDLSKSSDWQNLHKDKFQFDAGQKMNVQPSTPSESITVSNPSLL